MYQTLSTIEIPTKLSSLTCINFLAVILIFFQAKSHQGDIDLTTFIINLILQGVFLHLHLILFGRDSTFLLVASVIFILGVGFEVALFLRFKEKLKGKLCIAVIASATIVAVSHLYYKTQPHNSKRCLVWYICFISISLLGIYFSELVRRNFKNYWDCSTVFFP